MDTSYKHYIKLTPNQLHNRLIERKTPPMQAEHIKKTVAEQQAMLKSENARTIQLTRLWREFTEPLNTERENVQGMLRYKGCENDEARRDALEAYLTVLNSLKARMVNHCKQDRKTPTMIASEKDLPNDGTHWTMLQCNQTPNGTKECFFFDPYGAPPSENIKKVVANTNGKPGLPYNTKDIQSLMNNACGFYCLAMAHFVNSSQYRSNHLHTDVETFLDMFDDLNKSVDFKKNEYILKHFFRSEDPSLRKEIDVIKSTESITGEDERSHRPDMFKMPVDINYMNK